MGGFRLYDQNGVFISAFPGDARTGKARINLPWGQSCFKMRSYFTANGVELESADSNVGGCLTINPGPPVPPKVQ
jgi:hypothetical protein